MAILQNIKNTMNRLYGKRGGVKTDRKRVILTVIKTLDETRRGNENFTRRNLIRY